jgi:hypothetical protein
VASIFQTQLDAIQARVDETFIPNTAEEGKRALRKWRIQMIIDTIFLVIVTVLCIAEFFVWLNKPI